MPFPKPFLTKLAKEKQLTDDETEVFLALFGEGKTRLEITDCLHLSSTALNSRLTGIYKKFGILGNGPGKESRLREELKTREERWQKQQAKSTSVRHSNHSPLKDDLFEQIREYCRQKILHQHSRMRLLRGDEIGVDQLYVDVWLLNRSPRTFMISPSKLLESFDLRNDRLGLGDRIQRTQGFEVANDKTKLLILGKPGAGKTTFLKHLAVDWCREKFQPDLIAVLVEFWRIQDQQWGLMYAIEKELGLENWSQIQEIKKQISPLKKEQSKMGEIQRLEQQLEFLPLQVLLKQGKLLILMDGLDEAPTSELRSKAQSQLHQLVQDYPNNRFILSCRTQIIESIPNGFNSVEVADFSTEQVEQFVQNWFTASGQSPAKALQQWERFDNAVSKNPALEELTVTPVLLSLMCLVLQDAGEIPSEVDWLYRKGIKLLLSKWNDTKAIDSWEVGNEIYRQLSIEQKEALLTEIAVQKFENPINFVLFEQEEITAYITNFLQLANRQKGLEVLKAIEAQHGLLIERADELWSFSHLTFQEHFTLQWLTSLSSEQLAKKITNQQWQEVVKQLVKSQQPADRLVQAIKQAIDQLMKGKVVLQNFLTWLFEKSGSIHLNYQFVALRAFYFAIDRDIEDNDKFTTRIDKVNDKFTTRIDKVTDDLVHLARELDRDFAHAHNLPLDFAHAHNLPLDFAFYQAQTHARELVRTRARALSIACNLACELDRDLDYKLDRSLDYEFDDYEFDRALDYEIDLDLTLNLALDLVRILDYIFHNYSSHQLAIICALDYALDRAHTCVLDSELANRLKQLRESVATFSSSNQEFQQWWKANGIQWSEQFRQVMIEYRNIGHDWQFSDSQKQQLQRYYNANKFLVDLIKIKGAVSDEVYSEIEDSLLLPWAELQRRFPESYGESSE